MARVGRAGGFLGIACLIAACAGPSADDASNPSRVPTLIWEGEIDAAFVVQLEQFLTTGGHELVITSAGGSPEYGIAAAELISAFDVHVSVAEYCFSACANYVFLPAKSRTVRPRAIVGFHHDALSFYRYLQRVGVTANPIVVERATRFDAIMSDEKRFDWHEFSGSVLPRFEPLKVVRVTCTDQRLAATSSPCFSLISKYYFWVPQPQQLEQFDIDTDWEEPLVSEAEAQHFFSCVVNSNGADNIFGTEILETDRRLCNSVVMER